VEALKMSHQRVEVSAVIQAPAELVYSILADYREGHPLILPRQYFSPLEVEGGGNGAGTVIRFQMRVLGTTRGFRMAIDEPEPGRVLTETDVESGITTIFTVSPIEERRQSHAAIATELSSRGGVLGWLERVVTSAMLRRIYAQQLKLLAALAEKRSLAANRN